ncbi:glycosyltransferase family 2 protein [Salegentibacter sp. F188]|uniref:Glycosyltransferase family 2 protein n=1 Tax=Autumnicola patrickiae TaxID=3075591 RepID=A0ABU3DZG5_9FLAO|nr:glycosyltransferase family 2 protein [Salegentibacter sp. F188]MDT0688844.1 glycosyltransferase family 2 protein [Salegentibacter sp. F188]
MKVSIITVVYNNAESISDCIESVLRQSYANIEYLVIDGGSTDGTQKRIEPYRERIAYYISEKDSGIYSAFNKGIREATGDIIGIVNSDDFLFDEDTIKKIVQNFRESGADLLYGKGIYVSQNDVSKIKRIYPSNPFRKNYLLFGWIPLHPTIYVRREVYEKNGLYDQSYSIASDYDISLRWFKNDEIKKVFINEWIIKMRLGGKSTTASLQKKKSGEDLQIIKKHNLMGYFTLAFKIGRKIPHYLIPQFINIRTANRK